MHINSFVRVAIHLPLLPFIRISLFKNYSYSPRCKILFAERYKKLKSYVLPFPSSSNFQIILRLFFLGFASDIKISIFVLFGSKFSMVIFVALNYVILDFILCHFS